VSVVLRGVSCQKNTYPELKTPSLSCNALRPSAELPSSGNTNQGDRIWQPERGLLHGLLHRRCAAGGRVAGITPHLLLELALLFGRSSYETRHHLILWACDRIPVAEHSNAPQLPPPSPPPSAPSRQVPPPSPCCSRDAVSKRQTAVPPPPVAPVGHLATVTAPFTSCGELSTDNGQLRESFHRRLARASELVLNSQTSTCLFACYVRKTTVTSSRRPLVTTPDRAATGRRPRQVQRPRLSLE
jgi:hypothetical protein